jgi:RNA recognition motif-containing protein
VSKNLYVQNLPVETTSDDLVRCFADYGTVTSAQVVDDHETGRSRGFGFVEMSEGGERAIASLNGVQFRGQTLSVKEAKPRRQRPREGGSPSGRRHS